MAAGLRKKYPGLVGRLPERKRLSTGLLTVDAALGGGVPEGSVIEYAGPAGAGKTTMALMLMRQALGVGEVGVVLDYEHALTVAYVEAIAQRPCLALQDMGKAAASGAIFLTQPTTAEEGASLVFDMAEALKGRLRIVLLDSIASFMPGAELEGEFGNVRPGLQAQMTTKFLAWSARILTPRNITLALCNQVRADMHGSVKFGPPAMKAAGPKALEHYCWQRVWLSVGENTPWRSVWPKTHCTYLRVKKNKTSPDRLGATRVVLQPGRGFSRVAEVIDLAIECGVLDGPMDELRWNGRGPWSLAQIFDALSAEDQRKPLDVLLADVVAKFGERPLGFDLEAKKNTDKSK